MRRAQSLATVSFVILAGGACGLSLSDTANSGSDAASPMPTATSPLVDAGGDGPSLIDAKPVPIDGEPPVPSCGPTDPNKNTPFDIPKLATANSIRVDGAPTDWTAPQWHTIEKPYGASPAAPGCARFASAWDKDGLYTIVEVVDAAPALPPDPSAPWQNDAAEIFWGKTSFAEQRDLQRQGLASHCRPKRHCIPDARRRQSSQ